MLRTSIVLFVCLAFINFTVGCHSTEVTTVKGPDLPATKDKIVSAVLIDGTVVRYDQDGATYRETFRRDGNQYVNVLIGTTPEGAFRLMPADSVLEARVERREPNAAGTVLTVLGVVVLAAVAIVAIALATKQSCPFVYSFDGQKYQFDAEPLGGAVTEGLKRTDYSRLDYLQPSGGNEYRLLMKNEANESQYVDEMKLLVFDRPAQSAGANGGGIATDFAGNFFSYRSLAAPTSVTDEQGTSLMNFFREPDGVKWQSKMPEDTSGRRGDLRHQLTFTLPRPEGATSMSLLVNCGTALWGSNMIREMLMLRGNKVQDWYRDVDRHGLEFQNLIYFMEREELYSLKIYLKEGDTWTPRGVIRAGGPLIDEDRIVTLDLSHLPPGGEPVVFRINPPRGYWKFDYLGTAVGAAPLAMPAEIPPSSAFDQHETNISGLLLAADGSYYVMPEVGDHCRLVFPAPPLPPEGTTRTLYLKTSGYYRLHLPEDGPEQTGLIQELGLVPGKILDYSLERYLQWRQKYGSSH